MSGSPVKIPVRRCNRTLINVVGKFVRIKLLFVRSAFTFFSVVISVRVFIDQKYIFPSMSSSFSTLRFSVVVAAALFASFRLELPFSEHRIRQLTDRLMPANTGAKCVAWFFCFAIDNPALSVSQVKNLRKTEKHCAEMFWIRSCFHIIFN